MAIFNSDSFRDLGGSRRDAAEAIAAVLPTLGAYSGSESDALTDAVAIVCTIPCEGWVRYNPADSGLPTVQFHSAHESGPCTEVYS